MSKVSKQQRHRLLPLPLLLLLLIIIIIIIGITTSFLHECFDLNSSSPFLACPG
jgi:hypothetical protein